MNIIELETVSGCEKYFAPITDNKYPLIISEYGRTFEGMPCYQLRMDSPVSCLQYVKNGSGVIIYNDKIYTVKKGDTFLLKEGGNQIYYSNPDNNFERLWLNFRGILSTELMNIYGISDIVVFKNTDTETLISSIIEKCKSISDPEEYKDYCALAILEIIQFLSKNVSNHGTESAESVEKIRLYIDMHITENISLDDISAHFNFSKEHIIRIFKKIYNITPHKYIIQSKIRIAMIMLNTDKYSIEEISEKLCFSDPHHFSAQFCKNVGCRPSVYRERITNSKNGLLQLD